MSKTKIPLPSWLRWPPNCCETCTSWLQVDAAYGKCGNPASTNEGEPTDSRFRCQDFYRKPENADGQGKDL